MPTRRLEPLRSRFRSRRPSPRLAGAAAICALTAGVAADGGGFDAVAFDRALVGVAALTLVLAILTRVERPGCHAAGLLAALGLLTLWTAASWLWSDSPPLALEEAQRVALYLAVAAAVILNRRWLSVRGVAAGIVAGAAVIAVWNIVDRLGGGESAGLTGAGSEPVGYANSLALLCVLALLLLPALPRIAAVAALPLGLALVLQGSTGAYAALAAGIVSYAFMARKRARVAVVVVAVIGLAAAPFALRGHERTAYWHVAAQEVAARPLLGSGAGTFRDWWLRERSAPRSTQEAHSLYLETLAELGPIGLALLLIALGVPLVAAVRARRPELVAVLVAFDVAAAVDFHWELAGVTVPAILVAAVAVTSAPQTRAAPRAVVVPALAVLTAAAVLAYAGNARLSAATSALARGDPAGAAAQARRALRFAPFSAEAWRVIGDADSDATAYRRALALDPGDWSLWLRLARVSKGEPRRLALREAARLNPLGGVP